MATMNTTTDAQLVQQTLQGKAESFNALVERYLGVAQALAYAHVRTHADAEDVAQEAFLKAYESLDTLRDPAKFGAWLSTIVRHTSARVKERRLREANYTESQGKKDTIVHPNPEQQELRSQIRNEINQLDETLREVVVLHYFAGKSSPEIAELLDAKPTAIRKRLQRARETLGERLLEHAVVDVSPDKKRIAQVTILIAASSATWKTAEAATAASIGVTSLASGSSTKFVLAFLIVAITLSLSTMRFISAESSQKPTENQATPQVSSSQPPAAPNILVPVPHTVPATPESSGDASDPLGERLQRFARLISLSEMRQVNGRVTFLGEPVRNARIAIRSSLSETSDEPPPIVSTTPEGTYSVGGLSQGEYRLQSNAVVLRDGIEQRHDVSGRFFADTQEIEIDLPIAGGTSALEGQVLLGDKPIPNLSLSTSIVWENGFTERIRTHTNDEGIYIMRGLPHGLHTIEIALQKKSPLPIRERVYVQTQANATTRFDLSYEPASLAIDIPSVQSGETTTVGLILGEFPHEEITPALLRRLEIAALYWKQDAGSNITIPALPAGFYTVVGGAYDAEQPDELSTLATLRFTSEQIEVTPGNENHITLNLHP